MAHNKNKTKSVGLFQKFGNAVCPFTSRILRIPRPHQPHRPISTAATNKKTQAGGGRPSSAHTGPAARVSHQPRISETIPVQAEPPPAAREIEIESGRKFDVDKEKLLSRPTQDDLLQDNKVSEYIGKVRERMMKATSSIGGAGGEAVTAKDSFNDRVNSFINRTKAKIRKTTSVRGDESFWLAD